MVNEIQFTACVAGTVYRMACYLWIAGSRRLYFNSYARASVSVFMITVEMHKFAVLHISSAAINVKRNLVSVLLTRGAKAEAITVNRQALHPGLCSTHLP